MRQVKTRHLDASGFALVDDAALAPCCFLNLVPGATEETSPAFGVDVLAFEPEAQVVVWLHGFAFRLPVAGQA